MGPGNFSFQGWWIIPMVFCFAMMLFMFFGRGRRGFGPGMFMNQQETPRSGISESAIDVLNRRYAKGEISKGEYEEMKKNLSK